MFIMLLLPTHQKRRAQHSTQDTTRTDGNKVKESLLLYTQQSKTPKINLTEERENVNKIKKCGCLFLLEIQQPVTGHEWKSRRKKKKSKLFSTVL